MLFAALLYDLITVDQILDDTVPNKYNAYKKQQDINEDKLHYNSVKKQYSMLPWDKLDKLEKKDKRRYLKHFLFGPNDKFQSVTTFKGIIVNSILNLC